MTATNSSIAGCLRPLPALGVDHDDALITGLDAGILDGSEPLMGQAVNRFLQQWMVCVTGIAGTLFRPRWQVEPPNLPDVGVDWAAFGITNRKADVYPAIIHYNGAGGDDEEDDGGFDELQRHEEFDVLTSFYGPNAEAFGEILRDGVQVPQNQETLFLNLMGLIETGDIVTVPSLVKQQWLYRVDVNVRLRRQIKRDYRVLNLASAEVNLKAEADRQSQLIVRTITASPP